MNKYIIRSLSAISLSLLAWYFYQRKNHRKEAEPQKSPNSAGDRGQVSPELKFAKEAEPQINKIYGKVDTTKIEEALMSRIDYIKNWEFC